MDFNSLDAQREACEAFIQSQKAMGWTASAVSYEDGGFSGGNMDRPGLDRLLAEIQGGKIDFDRCIATPDMMALVGRLGKVLGPRGQPEVLHRAGGRAPGHLARQGAAAEIPAV